MRLLFSAFDPVPWPKGSGTRIEATIRAYLKAGARVYLHTPKAPKELPGFAPRLELENLTHEPVMIDEDNFLDRVLAFRDSLKALLEVEDFDAAVFRSPWEGIPIVESVPRVVYEAHGFPSVELSSHYPAVQNDPQILDRLIGEENFCLSRAQLFVTPSLTNRHFLMRRGAHPHKIRLVPNSVRISDFPEPSAMAGFEDTFRIGYMGTLAPWQGLGTLLEAIAQLRGRVPCRLVIAGTRKGRWIRQIRELAKRLRIKKCIEFHGALTKQELFPVLQSCQVLAAPLPNDPRNGLQGCCPIKLLEYMGCGRPILSTRISAVQEILKDQETAVLVKPGSASALAGGLYQLWQEPEWGQNLADEAKAQVEKRFSRDQFENQIRDVWMEIQRLKPRALDTL